MLKQYWFELVVITLWILLKLRETSLDQFVDTDHYDINVGADIFNASSLTAAIGTIRPTIAATAKPSNEEQAAPYRKILGDIDSLLPPPRNTPGKIALCATAESGARYVGEWLDYNIALGFDEIHITDNSPNSQLKIFDRTRSDRVFVYPTPNYDGTMLATFDRPKKAPFRHFRQTSECASYLEQFRPGIKYVAFFEVMEFLVLYNHSTLSSFLDDAIPDGRGALQINRRNFGTNFHSRDMDFPVTLRFQRRESLLSRTTNPIVRLEDIESMLIHVSRLRDKSLPVRHFGVGDVVNNCCVVADTATVPAALHAFNPKSLAEVRDNNCASANECFTSLSRQYIFEGQYQDDSAWKSLTKLIPKYKKLEPLYEKEMQKAYKNQTAEYLAVKERLKS